MGFGTTGGWYFAGDEDMTVVSIENRESKCHRRGQSKKKTSQGREGSQEEVRNEAKAGIGIATKTKQIFFKTNFLPKSRRFLFVSPSSKKKTPPQFQSTGSGKKKIL